MKIQLCAVALSVSALAATNVAQALDLQGHRGARAVLPENSLPGFAYALTTGVTTLEMDTALSRDGTVVVTHDTTLSPSITRNTEGAWLKKRGPAFWSLPLATIKTYDVGAINPSSRYAKRFPKQKKMDGVAIPTLDEVFKLVKRAGNKAVRFNIETKLKPTKPDESPAPDVFAKALLAVIEAHGMAPRVTVQSFDWRTLQAVQKLNGTIETSYLTAQQRWLDNVGANKPGASAWTAGLDADDFPSVPDMVAKAGGRVWSPYHREVDKPLIERAQDLGLKVAVWTVNDAPRMRALIEMGVDAIITDDPALLRRVMAERGLSLPEATPVTP